MGQRANIIKEWEEFFEEFDLLICPSGNGPAFPRCKIGTPISFSGKTMKYLAYVWPYNACFNASGHPSMSLPLGIGNGGLPVGVQIVGPYWSEINMLSFAKLISEFTHGFVKPEGYLVHHHPEQHQQYPEIRLYLFPMKPKVHRVYIGSMALIIIGALVYLIYIGLTYYHTPLEERFYHPDHNLLKPSGIMGHGLGILGSLAIVIGISVYMMRKRFRSMARMGRLKHWLEFHIFLCILGPVLILFHTSFKFGGLVSISFWSMVAVFLSGFIGRFIYLQIPRSIEGRELSLNEIRGMKSDLRTVLKTAYPLHQDIIETILESTRITEAPSQFISFTKYFRNYREDRFMVRRIRLTLKRNKLSRIQRSGIIKLVKNEMSINRKLERLQIMQNLFKYWHVVHMPFALLMLIIMVIHVAVTIVFGYRWIFI